nr:MAG TPA: hypothetical protein [Bacteriophage sp.]
MHIYHFHTHLLLLYFLEKMRINKMCAYNILN